MVKGSLLQANYFLCPTFEKEATFRLNGGAAKEDDWYLFRETNEESIAGPFMWLFSYGKLLLRLRFGPLIDSGFEWCVKREGGDSW